MGSEYAFICRVVVWTMSVLDVDSEIGQCR